MLGILWVGDWNPLGIFELINEGAGISVLGILGWVIGLDTFGEGFFPISLISFGDEGILVYYFWEGTIIYSPFYACIYSRLIFYSVLMGVGSLWGTFGGALGRFLGGGTLIFPTLAGIGFEIAF